MKINILTIFPEMFEGFFKDGVIGKALEKELIEINVIDFREYSENKHKKVDDYPYSGGAGMLLRVQPIDSAIIENNLQDSHIIFPSPIGHVFNNQKAKELAKNTELTFIAGRYEGVDQRLIDMHVDEQISLGDYILTGGELAIQVILDATLRYVDGVLGNNSSAHDDSFSNNLLEHPQYTRPREYKGYEVPEVLINGNHKLIEEFNREHQIKRTFTYRPDLLEKVELTQKDKEVINSLLEELTFK